MLTLAYFHTPVRNCTWLWKCLLVPYVPLSSLLKINEGNRKIIVSSKALLSCTNSRLSHKQTLSHTHKESVRKGKSMTCVWWTHKQALAASYTQHNSTNHSFSRNKQLAITQQPQKFGHRLLIRSAIIKQTRLGVKIKECVTRSLKWTTIKRTE